MSVTAKVFDALLQAKRPLTRIEVERITGLVRDEAYKGLIGLRLRGHLIVAGRARARVTYALTANAERPVEDLRGRYPRTVPHRHMMRQISLGVVPAKHRAAAPPTHYSAPGRSNVYGMSVHQGLVAASRALQPGVSADPCWLALMWPDPIRGEG